MSNRKRTERISKQPRRHYFFLNPYQDVRFTYCPKCGSKTRQRKFPLLIHVEPQNPVALNKTCRYCPDCDLIIAHRDEVEAQLAIIFTEHNPELIGNDYLVMGTMERAVWRRGTKAPMPIGELLDHLHVFKEVLQFRPAHYGWVKEDELRKGK
jgi:hypothetical protein